MNTEWLIASIAFTVFLAICALRIWAEYTDRELLGDVMAAVIGVTAVAVIVVSFVWIWLVALGVAQP